MSERAPLRVFALLFGVALLERFPFFFPAVIAWDESTFILVGQSLLDGHLPYVEAWALKPPLAFVFFAGVIGVFGKSLVAVRLMGAVCVAVAAWLLYLIACRLWTPRVGLAAALLGVTVASMGSGQATLTEHVALVPLLTALYVLVRGEPSAAKLFVAGMLLAASALVRLDLAYVAVIVGGWVLGTSRGRALVETGRRAGAYVAGGALVLALTWLPYLLSGQSSLLWRSAVLAPLRYAHAERSPLRNVLTHAAQAIDGPLVARFVWLAALGGAAVIAMRWRTTGSERRSIGLVLLFAGGICIGLLTGGVPYQHHLLDLAPFAALLAAVAVDRVFGGRPVPALCVVVAVIVLSLQPVAAEYEGVLLRVLAHEPLAYGPAYEIAAYLRRENPADRPVLLLNDHIAYWFLDARPPTRLTTHPALINIRPIVETVTGPTGSEVEELRAAFRLRPAFVVWGPSAAYHLGGELGREMDAILAGDYVVAARVEERTIYRRRASD